MSMASRCDAIDVSKGVVRKNGEVGRVVSPSGDLSMLSANTSHEQDRFLFPVSQFD